MKTKIINAMRAFIAQRSGIKFADYITGNNAESRRLFREDYNKMLRDGADARKLLAAIEHRDGITAENILASFRAHVSCLDIVKDAQENITIDFTPGQYFVTEYRAAACYRLAAVLLDHLLAQAYTIETAKKYLAWKLGRAIVNRWF